MDLVSRLILTDHPQATLPGDSTGSITAATEALHELFQTINTKWFKDSLPLPQITIQSRGRAKGLLGWCTTIPIWTGPPTPRYEINITAEEIRRTPLDIAATLIHEIAHLSNISQGIRDCTGHQYHNKFFVTAATALGLLCLPTTGRGLAETRPSPILQNWLVFWTDKHAQTFSYARADSSTRTKAPTKMKKWTCGCTIVRCAVTLVATCGKCGNAFSRPDPDTKEDPN